MNSVLLLCAERHSRYKEELMIRKSSFLYLGERGRCLNGGGIVRSCLSKHLILFFELMDWYWVEFDFCCWKGLEQLPLR